jgi:maltose alpha-D-glucosyltransferase/alpha-amylase
MRLSSTDRPAVPELPPAEHAESRALLDLSGLSNGEGLPDVLDLLNSRCAELESAALPSYLARRRWFGRKDQTLSTCRIACISSLPEGEPAMVLCEVETAGESPEGHGPERWLLPLAIVWARNLQPLSKDLAVAYVSFEGSAGLLTDAFSLAVFARSLLEGLSSAACIASSDGDVVFEGREEAGRGAPLPSDESVAWLSVEQSNSSLVVGSSVMLKIFRRVARGPHPEAEMTRYLTDGGFNNTPRLLGEVTRIDRVGQRHSLAVAQAFVANQGDAWTLILKRFAEHLDAFSRSEAVDDEDCAHMAAAIGRRLGEMHVVLARQTDDPAFSPRDAQPHDFAAWVACAEEELSRAYRALADADAARSSAARAELLQHRPALLRALPRLAAGGRGSTVSRIHGDFHLGQVLVADRDVYIIDFEGEPLKAIDERRAKASPLNDVAGMLRSFSYAVAVASAEHRSRHLPSDGGGKILTPMLQRAEASFLQAYRQAVTSLSGLENPDLLDLFLVRKAAYEICYEAANRPEWLTVPVEGLLEIVRRVVNHPAAPAP